jgi:hypothetical protein
VTAAGVPNSPSIALAQGSSTNAVITVTNTGNSLEQYFADPRLKQQVAQPILTYNATGVPLPLSLSAQPFFFVPPGTDHLVVAAHGTVPLVMDVTSVSGGDPDYKATTLPGNNAIVETSGNDLANGQYFALPEAQGPFPPTGVGPGAKADVSALIITDAFDTSVTSSAGDLWYAADINNASPTPGLVLAPTKTGTITVTFKPTAPKGTVVHGYILITTFDGNIGSGDQVIAIPYSYRVG